MNNSLNELREHIRRLNEIEQKKHELKREFAIKRIKELRQQLREKNPA